MFNTKRIIFLIGLLSIVALTGALMAGPAFAGKPDKGLGGASDASHRTTICHYQGYESALFGEVDDGTGTGGTITVEVKAEELEMWMAKMVDADSVDSHMANHSPDDTTYDFVIAFADEGLDTEDVDNDGQTGVNDSGADCTRLNGAL